jgi:hypothetical protein
MEITSAMADQGEQKNYKSTRHETNHVQIYQ